MLRVAGPRNANRSGKKAAQSNTFGVAIGSSSIRCNTLVWPPDCGELDMVQSALKAMPRPTLCRPWALVMGWGGKAYVGPMEPIAKLAGGAYLFWAYICHFDDNGYRGTPIALG